MDDPQPGGIRASDADRMQTAAVLQTAMSAGMLSFAEGDERLAAAYGATYRHQLDALTADLPADLAPVRADFQPACRACGRNLTSPGQLFVTAARLTLAQHRTAALVAALGLIMALPVLAGIGWALLHELGGFAPHHGYWEH